MKRIFLYYDFMSYRFMRMLVMFDLPVTTTEDLREYRRFRKFLIKNGFVMIQESIYSKIALNGTNVKLMSENIRKNKPKDGLVQLLVVTEKQYNGMEYIVGEGQSEVIDNDRRFIQL